MDKGTTLTLLQAFQNQLNNLSDRIETSEKMVLNLAKFFSNLVASFNPPSTINHSLPTHDTSSSANHSLNNLMDEAAASTAQSSLVFANQHKSKKAKENANATTRLSTTPLINNNSPLLSEQDINNILREQPAAANNVEGLFSRYSMQSPGKLSTSSNSMRRNTNEYQMSDVESETDSSESKTYSRASNGSTTSSSSSHSNRAPSSVTTAMAATSEYKYPYDLTNVEIPEHETTEEIAKKIKEYISILKISQRNFAESILNMKQANFSTLLSQPMSWPTLSKTYKDRFLCMWLWLNDFDRMDKLNQQPKNDFNNNSNNFSYVANINSNSNSSSATGAKTKPLTGKINFFIQNI